MAAPRGNGVSLRRKTETADDRLPPPGSDLYLIESVHDALEVLEGKWKVHLLFFMARGIHRHSKLLECLPGASKKVMTDSLRALERDGLVERRIFAEVPVRVEYSLTSLGWTLAEPLIALSQWGETHAQDVREARSRARKGDSADPAEPHVRGRRAAALLGER
jgi:DNA-binding HxlR family transcriptional regulator